MVKSVYLSTARFNALADRRRYERELDKVSEAIRRGAPVDFDAVELSRLASQRHFVESVRTRHVLLYLLRVFLPGIVILALIWAIYALVKFLPK